MELDAATCYQAIASRDRRFEGRFVVAVTTTRIYCRPGCPAPIPRRKNVRFYACAAAAEEAGFRACLRCRPDASPGTPAWQGTSATVSRALRLLTTDDADGAGVEALAERVGIGARHLRRLFIAHLGASPRAVAQTRRAHFARRLLDETGLTMTEVAMAAGYPSVRRFNDAIQRTFRATPTGLRAMRRPAAEAGRDSSELHSARRTVANDGALTLRLPFHPPLDWAALCGFLAPRATPGVEHVESGIYRRTIEWNGVAGSFEVSAGSPTDRYLRLRMMLPVTRDLLKVVGRVNRIFDLGADPESIRSFLAGDHGLTGTVRRLSGLRVPGAWDPFELAVRAILGQQVSVRGATTLTGRLVREFGEELPAPAGAGLTHLFPLPARLAEADLEKIGIPGARAETIRHLARAVRDGKLNFEEMRGLDEIVASLTALPGIGDWTAHYIAMRGFGEPDAFPASDLGIRKALGRDGKPASAREATRLAEAWRPWRSYAVMALWRSLAEGADASIPGRRSLAEGAALAGDRKVTPRAAKTTPGGTKAARNASHERKS